MSEKPLPTVGNCKDCKFWESWGGKWDVWPYASCKANQTEELTKGHEPMRCDTFHQDDHGRESIETHALFGCILFQPSLVVPE